MNRIKELRQERSMTQAELGKYLNVQNTTVSMYERNERQIDPPTIKRLCKLFECSSDYLLCRSEVRSSGLTEKETALLKAYRMARKKDQMLVETILSEYIPEEQLLQPEA